MSGIRAYSGRVAVGAAIPRLQVNSDRMDHFLTTDGSDEHNQAPGQVRGRATEGWPEGRDERERTSQIGRQKNHRVD
jgi:hypothetical protein